jgi:MFS family permease
MTVRSEARRYAGLLTEPPLQAVLFLVFVGTIGIQAVPPALSSVGAALSVSDGQVGLVVTAFFLPAAVALPVVGFVADVYGRRPVAIVSLLVYGGAGLATALAGDFSVLLALRALQGVAFPGLIPLSITLAGDLYAGARGSVAQGLRISVNGLAATLTPAAAGVLAGIAWYYPFWLTALAFPVAAFVYVFLPETVAADTLERPRGSISGTLQSYVRSVAGALGDPALLVLIGGAFVTFFGRFAVYTFLPLYAVRELQASTAMGGLLLSVIGATRILVPLFAGAAVAAASRKASLVGALAVATVAVAVIPAVGNIWLLAVVVGVYGAAFSLFMPVLNDTVTAMAAPERRASVVNTMELGKTAAIGLSPAAFGVVLAVAGFSTLFVLAAGVLGAYAVVAAVVLASGAIE